MWVPKAEGQTLPSLHEWKGEGLLCNVCDFRYSPLRGSRFWCHLGRASCPKPWGLAAFSITDSIVFPPLNENISIHLFLGPDGLVPTTHLNGSLRRLMHFGNIKKQRKQCKLRLTNPRGVGGGLSPQASPVCCAVGLPKPRSQELEKMSSWKSKALHS